MAKYKETTKGQGYFLPIYPEELFENTSTEKTINKFIEEYVDISEFDKKYKNDETGQKAISPRVKLKVIIYGLSQGIESMRKIERMLRASHPGFLYLSGGTILDHSTLCNFIADFPEEIKSIFSRLLCMLGELELIDWRRIMIDGTRVESNASKKLTGDKKYFKKKLKKYEELASKLLSRSQYISKLQENGDMSNEDAVKENKLIKKQQHKYEIVIDNIKSYDEEVESGKISSKDKVNITDRESRLLVKNGTGVQGYNVQAAFSNNDILLSIEALSVNNDQSLLSHMVNQVETVKNKLTKVTSDYLLDKGYFNPAQINTLIDADLRLFIPPPENFEDSWFISQEQEVLYESDGLYLLCKGGRKKKGWDDKNNNSYNFVFTPELCEGCEHHQNCWGKDKKTKVFTVSKAYVNNKDFWLKYKARTKEEDWKYKYNKRIGKEHNFYDLKHNNGLTRLNWRGKIKCNTVVTLAGISYNLKKFNKAVIDIDRDKVTDMLVTT